MPKRTRWRTLGFCAAAAVGSMWVGCADPARDVADESTTTAASPTPAAVTDTLARLSEAFSRAYVDQDLESMAAAYTTDALVLAGEGPIVEGRESIAGMFRMPDGVRLIHHQIVPRRVVVEGDMAWDVGVYEFQAVANGDTLPMRYGKYAVVWERNDTGTWRMAMDMWSPRPSPENTTEDTTEDTTASVD